MLYIRIKIGEKEGYFGLNSKGYKKIEDAFCVPIEEIDRAKHFEFESAAQRSAQRLQNEFNIQVISLDVIKGNFVTRSIDFLTGESISYDERIVETIVSEISDNDLMIIYEELRMYRNGNLKIENSVLLNKYNDIANQEGIIFNRFICGFEKEIMKRWYINQRKSSF